jgi:hypothetical protein
MVGNTEPKNLDIQKAIDPRSISKELDPGGRDVVAQQVWDSRRASEELKNEGISVTEKLEKIASDEPIKTSDYSEAYMDLRKREQTRATKILNLLRIPDRTKSRLETRFADLNQALNDQYIEQSGLLDRQQEIAKNTEELPDARELIDSYYERVGTLPLTNEEKRELLTPEALADLDTDEYIALWRRLNPHFLSHVTRQGFRDHTGNDVMVSHDSGYMEFDEGFTKVMQNGRNLLPPLGRIGLADLSDETVNEFVTQFFSESTEISIEEAKERFHKFLNFGLASAPKYADITATHFAAQIVSDSYYGGEADNEVMFVYPSDVLASQYPYAFNGWEKTFTEAQSETKWNDVFVWTDPNKPGVPVDSGVVFLPRSTQVDPETGSKYASEAAEIDGKPTRKLLKDNELEEKFRGWSGDIGQEIYDVIEDYKTEMNYFDQRDKERLARVLIQNAIEQLGFPEDVVFRLGSRVFGELLSWGRISPEDITEVLEQTGAVFKRPENAVPSKDYWEDYFNKNPHLRPAHVYYYDGSPTSGVYNFLQENGIGNADTSKEEGALLGFDDNHVLDMESDARSNQGYDELLAKANRRINEIFGGDEPSTEEENNSQQSQTEEYS